MLNASENEVDVEGLNNDVKLEFEAGNDEVATWNMYGFSYV